MIRFDARAAASCAFLSILLLAGGCGGDDPAGPTEPEGGDWTILAYMAGNNNLDYSENINSFVMEDLQEMEMVQCCDKVEIVAVISSLKNGGDANVYRVEYHPNEIGDEISSTLLEAWGQKDMSDPTTLRDFLELGLSECPSERTLLIIDNHGAGWRGACTDDPAGGQPMTMRETKQAILDARPDGSWDNRFDMILFHACLMASAEVAYSLEDVADYMVACQFVMPMESILSSNTWISRLSDDPGLTPAQLGSRIAQDIKAKANAQGKVCHMSVLDLAYATQLTSQVGDLGDALPSDPGDPLWAEVLDAWMNTHVTDYDDPATVDLRELVNNILNEPNLAAEGAYVETMAQQVLDTINQMVVFTTTNAIGITRGGMNVYMPYLQQQWDPAYMQTDFAANNWDTFVRSFIEGIETLLTGTLNVDSQPQGAAVALDGEDTGATTPASFDLAEGSYRLTLSLDGYMPWTQTVQVRQGQATEVDANLVEEGGGDQLVVQGQLVWHDGRPLTDAYLLLYEEEGGYLELAFAVDVDEATGNFTQSITGDRSFWIEGFDDVEGSQDYSAGDGWNAIDNDDDGQYPTWGDAVPMSVGNTYTVSLTLYEAGGKTTAASRIFRPARGGPDAASLAAAAGR